MTALPTAAANAGDTAATASLDDMLPDLVLEETVTRVRDWGGNPRRYRLALSRGLDALGGDADPADVRSLAAVAGWRAGVLDLRDDALARAVGLPAAAAARTLGLAAENLDWFLTAHYEDRFAWPDQKVGDVIARVGGFRGLGGSWIVHPREAAALGDGRFRVICGDESWIIRADVFGASLTPADVEQATAPAVTGGAVDAVVSIASYLVDLVRRT